MIEFEIKSRKQTIGPLKGKTVYYAMAKNKNYMTLDAVCQQIVDETSLSYGDVMNALITLGRLVCRGLKMGFNVDLGDLGSFRVYFPSKMSEKETDVTAASLKTPKVVFTPKAKMREAAKTAEVSVNNPKRKEEKKKKKKEEGGIGQHGN